ncbi:hypothetical protein [Colwellia sp. MEBiC06753]
MERSKQRIQFNQQLHMQLNLDLQQTKLRITKKFFTIISLVLFLSQTLVSQTLAGQYKAAYTEFDISPVPNQDKVYLLASNPTSSFTITDPLLAKLLVISDGQKQIGIIALDVINLPPATWNTITSKILKQTQFDLVLMHSTHSHSGFIGPSKVLEYNDEFIQQFNKLSNNLKPVEIAAFSQTIDQGYNRIQVNNNQAQMLWTNPDHIPSPASNSDLNVIDIKFIGDSNTYNKEHKKAINKARTNNNMSNGVTLINYNAHPVISMDRFHPVVSGDYPAYLAKQMNGLNRKTLFLTGAAGDINPYDAGTTPISKAQIKAQELAIALFQPIAKQLNQTLSYRAEGTISFASKYYNIPLITAVESDTSPARTAQVNVIQLTSDIAFSTFSGEFFSDFANQLKAANHAKFNFLIGYTNGNIGYVPTLAAAAIGGYGASPDSISVAPGLGEQMIFDAQAMLKKITDKRSN